MSSVFMDTPHALVENGTIHSGFFKTPFRRVNLTDALQPGGVLGKPFRCFRLKEWIGFGFNHPSLYGGVLLQNAKYAASGTFYCYLKEPRTLHDWTLVANPLRLRLPETMWRGAACCGNPGRQIAFALDLEHGRHQVRADIKESKTRPALSAHLIFHQDWEHVEPLVVSLPIQPRHHTYTHKSPLRIEGSVRIGAEEYPFDPVRDMGNLDEQKTFYPYRSHWLWGCFSGFSAQGREVMVNLVNQMTAPGAPSEDAMWVDGKLMLLKPAAFMPGPDAGSYRIEDSAGRIRLRFRAQGAKIEKRRYGPIAMDYAQHFGPYDGVVTDERGTTHSIDCVYGALERMNAYF